MRKVVIGGVAVLLLQSCSNHTTESTPPPAENGRPAEAPAPTATGGQTVSGTVPAAANGQPSIVVLDPREPREYPTPAQRPVMDQIAQTFVPDVLFVRTGQPVVFHSSDEVLHNLNVIEEGTKQQQFNVVIPTDAVYEFTFKRDGFYDVRCDIHQTMAAVVVATSTPYAMRADASGHFAFDGVAPGAYRVTVYAGTETLHQDVDVRSSGVEVTVMK